jgi:hypothetical protein
VRRSVLIALAGFLLASASACDSETEAVGLLTFAFETSAFLPCGHQEAWWVTPSEDLVRRYAALRIPDGQSAYARLKGERSDRGRYGHLDAYRYAFEVTEVITLRRAGAGCGASGRNGAS